jgi:hypothetical protein
MSNDDRLARRGNPIPVSVRRPPAQADDPLSPARPEASVTQPPPQVIYINNMPAPAPAAMPPPFAAPPPAPPQQIHHHYHPMAPAQAPRVSVRIVHPPGQSALGTAAMALGIIACLICWIPVLGMAAVPIGAIGAGLGLLGVVVSTLFRRSSAGFPLAAVIVCCVAGGVAIQTTRSLPYWSGQLRDWIKGVQSGSSVLSPTSAAPALPRTDSEANVPTRSPAGVAPPTQPPHPMQLLDAPVASARDRLIEAERACDLQTMQSAEYQAALAAAQQARAKAAALRDSSPGSDQSRQAAADMIQADNALSAILAKAESADPNVIAARAALAQAHAAAGNH